MNRNNSEEDRVTRFAVSFLEVAPRVVIALTKRFGISGDEAADVLDETLVKLLQRVRGSKEKMLFERLDQKDLSRYLTAAVLNRYRDNLKHRSVVERSEQELLYALDEIPSPESVVSLREQVGHLRLAVTKLKRPYRELFEALLTEDVTLVEFAQRRGIKAGTIYARFSRGLSALRGIWSRETLQSIPKRRKDDIP